MFRNRLSVNTRFRRRARPASSRSTNNNLAPIKL
jgi:hypothetical protein